MGVFFLLGGLARAADLYGGIEGLRGVPPLMAALMCFSPLATAAPALRRPEFWRPRGIGILRGLVVIVLLLLGSSLLYLGICAYASC